MPSNGYFSFVYKMIEKHLRNSFLLYLVVKILQLAHKISSFPEVLCKRGVLKNLSKFSDNHKKHASGSVLSKDVLKNIAKFTEKYICQNLFLNKSCRLETLNCQKQPLKMVCKTRCS